MPAPPLQGHLPRGAGADAGEPAGQARAVLGRYGKTFRLAGWFLPSRVLDQAALLYAFCREVDDIADDAVDLDAARVRLDALHLALQENDPDDPLAVSFLRLSQTAGVPVEPALLLIRTVTSDLGTVRIEDEAHLVRYAHGVAGTVGLMMCPILGASDTRALRHATDLGIAMQLTNIARDVVEDAARGRTYLPAAWLRAHTPEGSETPSREGLFAVVRQVLELAAQHYRSGNEGLHFLPPAVRTGVLAASCVYQEIGTEILRRGPSYLGTGRCVVSRGRKLALAASCVWPRLRIPGARLLAAGRRGIRA